jgi:hypothetical protein
MNFSHTNKNYAMLSIIGSKISRLASINNGFIRVCFHVELLGHPLYVTFFIIHS